MNNNIKTYALSFVGRRKNNQDNCIAINIEKSITFLAVADGMGGTIGGEIASKLILDNAVTILKKNINERTDVNSFKNLLKFVFQSAQNLIQSKVENNPELSGMGTTLTCVLIMKDKFVWGNLGDSRIYHITNRNINQISVDHTYVQDYINEHGANLPQSTFSNFQNYLTKAIDGSEDKADIFPKNEDYATLSLGEGFILCSDGLIADKTDNDTYLSEYVFGSRDLESAAKNLISRAYHNGSSDNISVVLAEYGKFKRSEEGVANLPFPPNENSQKINPAKKKRNHKKRFNYFYLIILLVIIGVGREYFKTESAKNSDNEALQSDEIITDKESPQNSDIGINNNSGGGEGYVWKPLNEAEFNHPFRNETINWLSYDGEGEVKEYLVNFSRKGKIITYKTDDTIFDLTDIELSKGDYKLQINVELDNGMKINGNQVDIIIEK